MTVKTERFNYPVDLSDIYGDFKHIAIETNHPTIMIINNQNFRIGYNCILELFDCHIDSITCTDTYIDGIITYEKEGS